MLALALSALGCSSTAGEPSASTPTADPDELAVAAITWQGGVEEPKLEMATPLRVTEPTIGLIERGSGDRITMGQLVTFDSLVVDGETGEVESSTFGTETPERLIISPNTANVTMLTAMQSASVGARFLYVIPDGRTLEDAPIEDATGENAPVGQPSKVIGISIRSAESLPAEAAGKAGKPDPALPTVEFAADGTPELKPMKGEPGSDLAVAALIEGTGPAVTEGQTLGVKYGMWLWDGTPVGTAWGDLPAVAFNLDEAISGWRKAIVGKKVGSRILMVLPPALAYGGAGQDGIPPDSTLVVLVDILAAY